MIDKKQKKLYEKYIEYAGNLSHHKDIYNFVEKNGKLVLVIDKIPLQAFQTEYD